MKPEQQKNPFIVLEENLPEIFHERLIELQITEKLWFFMLGDLTNDIWQWCVTNRAGYRVDNSTIAPFTFEMICWYVGRKLDGKHGTTSIYNYSNLSQRMNSKRMREKYARLPISHFDYASQFDDKTMVRILEYSLEQTDIRGGRPPSRNDLIKHFEPEKFETQRDLQDQAPPIDDESFIPNQDDPIWAQSDLPVNYDEIKLVNTAFQYLQSALQRFRRQNPKLEIVGSIIQTVVELNQKLLQMIGEQVRRE